MGIYGNTLECGCIQQTLTFETPIRTITIQFCKKHKPQENDKINESNTKSNIQSR
jgi:hypothetical protein